MAITPLMPVYPRSPVRPVRGEGAYLYGEQGERYLDFAAGIAVNLLGHGHPHLTRAIQDQAATLMHVSNLYGSPQGEAFAQRLVDSTFALLASSSASRSRSRAATATITTVPGAIATVTAATTGSKTIVATATTKPKPLIGLREGAPSKGGAPFSCYGLGFALCGAAGYSSRHPKTSLQEP